MQPIKCSAWSNDSVALITWLPEAMIPGCLGFAITRIDVATGTRQVLDSRVPFEGQDNSEWQAKPTTQWPIQKCQWMDRSAKYGQTVKYEIVPVVGTPDNPTLLSEMACTTNDVTFDVRITEYISAAFTRGVLSSQWLANQLGELEDGTPDFNKLVTAITTPGHPIRQRLMGNVMKLLKAQIEKAKAEGGHVHLALYELSDPEVVGLLLDNVDVFSLILSNTGVDDETNKEARTKLHAAGADILDRMLSAGSIGHNKSQARVGADKRPKSITSGSTNLTPTGLTCQSNSVIQIDSEELAQQYIDYWMLLRADGAEQGDELRKANATRKKDVVLSDGTGVTVWFSPNTMERTKPKENPPTPPDMAEVFELMDSAKQAVFFLCFYPGFPSILSRIKDMSWTRKDLILRGVVSSAQAMPRGRIYQRWGELPKIVVARGIEEQFANWSKELLKLPDAHAIVHDKVVVKDPWSETDCALVVGAHNLGFKASYSNDENMLIIRGCRKVVMAYLVHIVDVYTHYRFRSAVGADKSKFKGYLVANDSWLNKFLKGYTRRELELYVGIEPAPLSPTTGRPVAAVAPATAPVQRVTTDVATVAEPVKPVEPGAQTPVPNPVMPTVEPVAPPADLTSTRTDNGSKPVAEAPRRRFSICSWLKATFRRLLG